MMRKCFERATFGLNGWHAIRFTGSIPLLPNTGGLSWCWCYSGDGGATVLVMGQRCGWSSWWWWKLENKAVRMPHFVDQLISICQLNEWRIMFFCTVLYVYSTIISDVHI